MPSLFREILLSLRVHHLGNAGLLDEKVYNLAISDLVLECERIIHMVGRKKGIVPLDHVRGREFKLMKDIGDPIGYGSCPAHSNIMLMACRMISLAELLPSHYWSI